MTNYNGKEVLNGLLLIKSMMSVENVERQAIALRKLANKAGVVEHEKRITKGANVYTILITNSDGIDEDARIYADDIYYVNRKSMLIGQLKHLQSFEAYGARFQVKERANGENRFIKNL